MTTGGAAAPPSPKPDGGSVANRSGEPPGGRPDGDLARTVLQLLAIGALIASSLWIMRPFLVALIWASMIAVATWPLMLRIESRLAGLRSLAVAFMTAALLLLLLVPLYVAITALITNAPALVNWSAGLATSTLPPPPAWLESLPLVGAPAAARWHELVAVGPGGVMTQLAPYAQRAALWLVSHLGGAGALLLQFLLTVVIAAILYARGETAVRTVDRFARRLAGPSGVTAVHLAAQAIRAVALGVVVTAIVQASLCGLGLVVVAVPFAPILTALIFLLSIAQIGPAPVLILAVIWVYTTSGGTWGTAFLVWAIGCGTIDNVLRPLLIRRGADLPLLLIFVGVIGGLIAFGVIGLFIGPVVLAVAYRLLEQWIAQEPAPAAPSQLS